MVDELFNWPCKDGLQGLGLEHWVWKWQQSEERMEKERRVKGSPESRSLIWKQARGVEMPTDRRVQLGPRRGLQLLTHEGGSWTERGLRQVWSHACGELTIMVKIFGKLDEHARSPLTWEAEAG